MCYTSTHRDNLQSEVKPNASGLFEIHTWERNDLLCRVLHPEVRAQRATTHYTKQSV